MKIYTLVGRSGTGKSFHAINLCKKYDIDAIIDDGLFIYRGIVVEGVSAKKSPTKIGAIKTALFYEEGHMSSVKDAIKKKRPPALLIIGTSDRMTNQIIERLELVPEGESEDKLANVKRIYIEEITTEEERETAHEQRNRFGKHVVPAPSMQLKKNFAGYFMDPLRLFRGIDLGAAAERTVVRPSYSYMGEYFIEERVISDIISCVAAKIPAIHHVLYVSQIPVAEAYKLSIAVKLNKNYPIWESAMDFQKEVHSQIENMTAFNVVEVNCEVKGIV